MEFIASAGASAGQQKTLTYMTALPINQLSDNLHVAVCLSVLSLHTGNQNHSLFVRASRSLLNTLQARPPYNLMLHSHLMLSQCYHVILGGILGGTQC